MRNMKKNYLILLGVLMLWLVGFGLVAALDRDESIVVEDGHPTQLAQRPKFTLSSWFSGDYASEYESYYNDQFPGRSGLSSLNRQMNAFYTYSGGSGDSMVVIGNYQGSHGAGERLDNVQDALNQAGETVNPSGPKDDDPDSVPDDPTLDNPQDNPDNPGSADNPDSPDTSDPSDPGTADTPPEQTDQPWENPYENADAFVTDNAILILDNRAIEVPYSTYSVVASYAQAVSNIAAAVGEGVTTYSLITPNQAQFYTPEFYHTGNYDQKAAIDYAYQNMTGVKTVDAYDKIAQHLDEYVYFRTDHHWTALGAYYAYTAFCETAGLEAVPLDQFQTGRYEGFVGTMYNYTKGYAQSQVLLDNPDYVDYYLPIVESHARYFSDASMTDGIAIYVVNDEMSDSVGNKYLCFISGDTPLCRITTAAGTGRSCVVLKESYGNAFVPFLTSHYDTIYVIDPREFNGSNDPSFDLTSFVAEHEVNDVIVINYPFKINDTTFINRLNRLVGVN